MPISLWFTYWGASDLRLYQRVYLRCAVRFLSVILFNYFLTEPRLSLVAYGSKYPITFAVMFAAALLTGTLAAKLKVHAQLSARDAYRTKLLFDMNRQLQKARKRRRKSIG